MHKTYTTVSGDRWDDIAFRILGDEKYSVKMMELNPEYADVFIFSAGTMLVLPEKEAEISDKLPPWKVLNR